MSSFPVEATKLSFVESRLSVDTPFGNHEFILASVARVYIGLLAMLADESAAAANLLNVLGNTDSTRQQVVLRDSLVRRTVEDGIGTVVEGVDAIERDLLDELLTAAARTALTDQPTLLGDPELSVPFSCRGSCRGYVWVGGQSDASPARRFEDQVLKRLPGFRFHLPTEDQIRAIVAGDRLASLIAPDLARSAISHAFIVVVGVFEGVEHLLDFNALTLPGLPGVIVVSPKAIRTDIDVAERLVHESTHLKFLDIDYTQPLFARGFRPENSPLVTPAWHEEDPLYGGWPIDRVLTSMHVYLTLCVFFGNAGHRVRDDAYTQDYAAARVTECTSRAAWLYEAAQGHLEVLTPAGRNFVAAVGEMLAELDT
jgi:hypothetical protein